MAKLKWDVTRRILSHYIAQKCTIASTVLSDISYIARVVQCIDAASVVYAGCNAQL